MKITAHYLLVMGLTLVLAGVGAWAQGGPMLKAVQPLSTYKGSVADETLMAKYTSPVSDQMTLAAMWASWGITDPLPVVDFTAQLVVFSTTRGSVLNQTLMIDGAGNLTVGGMSSRDLKPGFRYVIAVISNAGISSVNGTTVSKAGPVTSTILAKGSVDDDTLLKGMPSFITDAQSLAALWKSWSIAGTVPTVDFSKNLVMISTTSGSLLNPSFNLTATGDLQDVGISTMDFLPGFRYVLSEVSRAGVVTVGGKPLNPVPSEVAVTILQKASSTMSNFETRQFLTVTDEKMWDGLWGAITPPLTVDFTKDEALLVTMGQKNTGGYSIAITGVTESATRLTATVKETSPRPGMMTIQMLTFPYAVVVIQKSDKPVYFNDVAAGGTIVPVINTITTADSLHTDAGTAVIKDVATWKELYDKQMPAGTALPDVNFGDNMVLVVFAGQQSVTGVTMSISTVKEMAGKIVVNYSITVPKTVTHGAIPVPPAGPMDGPMIAVVVPKSDLPVTFIKVPVMAPPVGGGGPVM